MRILLRLFDGVVWWTLVILVAVMSLAIFVQVVGRVTLGLGLVGAEEFAVLLFAWIIFIGVGYLQKTDSHLSVASLREIAGLRVGLLLDVFRLLVVAVCSAVAIWQGIALAIKTLPLLYPTNEITRAWLYASVPVGFAIGLIYMVENIYDRWLKK